MADIRRAFGHRLRAHTVAEVFQEAAVSPNDLKDLVDRTMELLNVLTRAATSSAS